MFILLGGLLGGILGKILQLIAPKGNIQKVFSTAHTVGITEPVTLDLILFEATFGFSVTLSLLMILGVFLGAYLYKQF